MEHPFMEYFNKAYPTTDAGRYTIDVNIYASDIYCLLEKAFNAGREYERSKANKTGAEILEAEK